MSGVDQGIVIEASSAEQLHALDLIHVHGLSLADHPRPTPVDGGRVSLGGDATDVAIATLRARGCTPEHGCEIRVVESKEEKLRRWKTLDTQVDRGDGSDLR